MHLGFLERLGILRQNFQTLLRIVTLPEGQHDIQADLFWQNSRLTVDSYNHLSPELKDLYRMELIKLLMDIVGVLLVQVPEENIRLGIIMHPYFNNLNFISALLNMVCLVYDLLQEASNLDPRYKQQLDLTQILWDELLSQRNFLLHNSTTPRPA